MEKRPALNLSNQPSFDEPPAPLQVTTGDFSPEMGSIDLLLPPPSSIRACVTNLRHHFPNDKVTNTTLALSPGSPGTLPGLATGKGTHNGGKNPLCWEPDSL